MMKWPLPGAETLVVERRHECPERLDEHGLYGPAVTSVVMTRDGRWWSVSHEEYATRIQYFPWCGIDLSAPS